MAQSAQTKARTWIAERFGAEYYDLYLKYKEEYRKASIKNYRAKAQNKAKTVLIEKYPAVYRELYDKAVAAGYHRGHTFREDSIV